MLLCRLRRRGVLISGAELGLRSRSICARLEFEATSAGLLSKKGREGKKLLDLEAKLLLPATCCLLLYCTARGAATKGVAAQTQLPLACSRLQHCNQQALLFLFPMLPPVRRRALRREFLTLTSPTHRTCTLRRVLL